MLGLATNPNKLGTSREPSERNFYVGISKVNNKIIRSFYEDIKYLRTKLTYYLRRYEGTEGNSNFLYLEN